MASISLYPVATGTLRDINGSFQIPLIAMAGSFAAAALLIQFLGRYRPARES